MLDTEFDAVTYALREYLTAIRARAGIKDFQDHITADKLVRQARIKLEQALKDLGSAEECEYSDERRAILEISPEGDDIPF